MNLEKTIEFIQKAHSGQTDKSGKPYWFHPVAVSIIVPGNTDIKIAALLHDVVEDTSYSAEDLKKLGYNDNVLEVVELVTRTKEKGTYKEWIKSIAESNNIGAICVKLADNIHNSSPSRASALDKKVREGLGKRYFKSRNVLLKQLKKINEESFFYLISFCDDNKIPYDKSLRKRNHIKLVADIASGLQVDEDLEAKFDKYVAERNMKKIKSPLLDEE